jgi:hypothetical protein
MIRRIVQAFAALGVLIAIPLGCRNIIGIQERQFDELSCESYCAKMAETCTGANQQYASDDACQKLCKSFPVGSIDDQEGNSLGCRINAVKGAASTGEAHDACLNAGPGGNDTCGSNCDSFCASLEIVCQAQFDSLGGDCLKTCQGIPDCGDYQADPLRDDNSLQCRLFHLSSAAVQPETHCKHTLAISKCGGDANGVVDAGSPCVQTTP